MLLLSMPNLENLRKDLERGHKIFTPVWRFLDDVSPQAEVNPQPVESEE